MPGVNTFYRSVGGSLLGAAALVAWDGMLYGSALMSVLVCPVWILLSLIKNAVERPGWGLALARLAIPALTLAVLWVNKDYQSRLPKRMRRESWRRWRSITPITASSLKPLTNSYRNTWSPFQSRSIAYLAASNISTIANPQPPSSIGSLSPRTCGTPTTSKRRCRRTSSRRGDSRWRPTGGSKSDFIFFGGNPGGRLGSAVAVAVAVVIRGAGWGRPVAVAVVGVRGGGWGQRWLGSEHVFNFRPSGWLGSEHVFIFWQSGG